MPEYLRALIYVLIVAVPAFAIAKKIAVPFVDEDEFCRWRNCWIATTCAAFLSSSFFAFAAMVLLISIYIHRSAKQPIYFYIILMFAAPCVQVSLGMPGLFNKVIDVNTPRLLELSILLPLAASLWMVPKNRQIGFFDVCVGAFFLLISLLSFRHGDTNSILRANLQYLVDILLPYFVFSRAIQSAKDVNQALLAFAVAAMPLAAVGILETWKGWRVYYMIVQQWGVVLDTPYLVRDDLLRAAATSIQPIAFGFLCMTGASCLSAARTEANVSLWKYAALALLVAGLFSSLSRGPWLGFAVFVILLVASHLQKTVRALAGFAPLILGAIYFLPSNLGQRFVNLLPFIGSADKGSESYRSELFANAMIVIERYPFFGSQTYLEEPEMQRMLQGQGIVDVVNSYLQIALDFGLVGLFLFFIFFLTLGTFLFVRTVRPAPHQSSINVGGLLALLIAMLFTIATTSSIAVIPFIIWAFAGLCTALSRMRREVAGRSGATEVPVKMRVLKGI